MLSYVTKYRENIVRCVVVIVVLCGDMPGGHLSRCARALTSRRAKKCYLGHMYYINSV